MENATPWKRMIEAEFNRCILVEDARKFRKINQTCQIGLVVLSGSATATLLAAWSFIAIPCSIATAALSAVTLWKRYADNAAECEALAKEWQRLKTGFEHAHERGQDGTPLSEDARQMLQLEFDRLVQLRQEPPEPDRDKAVMDGVLQRVGYSDGEIDSLAGGPAAA